MEIENELRKMVNPMLSDEHKELLHAAADIVADSEKLRDRVAVLELDMMAARQGLDCPDCPNQGWYSVGVPTNSGDDQPVHVQCEFCCTVPASKFNIADTLEKVTALERDLDQMRDWHQAAVDNRNLILNQRDELLEKVNELEQQKAEMVVQLKETMNAGGYEYFARIRDEAVHCCDQAKEERDELKAKVYDLETKNMHLECGYAMVKTNLDFIASHIPVESLKRAIKCLEERWTRRKQISMAGTKAEWEIAEEMAAMDRKAIADLECILANDQAERQEERRQ